ncbi:SDR family NAD(P)-dependent oxidoreductase [Leptothoe sp. ISB3NOV94-8A]
MSQPTKLAYVFLQDGEIESGRLTYQELAQQVRVVALGLQSVCAVGDRALLLYPQGLAYIVGFLGCLDAGVIAVPAYPPRRNQRKLGRLQAIAKDAQATVALTTAELLPRLQGQCQDASELNQLHWLATDSLVAETEQDENWRIPIDPSDLAFLQYTSGSTGIPKGVMVSHGNLMHNCETIKRSFELTPDDVSVTWLPSFHDMGLIDGILQPLYTGFPGYIMPPAAFLQRPQRWLQAISKYRATHSGGPNFAYDLCSQRITAEQRDGLDLSCWQSAYNGAEPLRLSTLERFTSKFSSVGFQAKAFYPCYGMAETTLMVSGGEVTSEPGHCIVDAVALGNNQVIHVEPIHPNAKQLVGCGQTWLDTTVAIVNPETCKQCVDNQVGEIWVTGGSVAQGYWRRSESSEFAFHAHLADNTETIFFRTGDLGFLHNGDLFITGRLKDVIIIRGRNHYPQDIERTVEESHPALRSNSGAAFSIEVDQQERLVVVQEVKRTHLRHLNSADVVEAIRSAVPLHHEVQLYDVVLLKPGRIPKTSSGKIQRRACRTQFLAGELQNIAVAMPVVSSQHSHKQSTIPWRSPADAQEVLGWFQAQVRDEIAQFLSLAPDAINLDRSLLSLGLDSLKAVELLEKIGAKFRLSLPPTLLFEYPTLAQLVTHLAQEYREQLECIRLGQVPDQNQDNPPEYIDISGKEVASYSGPQTPNFGGFESNSPALKRARGTFNQGNLSKKTSIDGAVEDIAIIGMACHFPQADDLESFWHLLRSGQDAITEVPPSRWNWQDFYDPVPAPDKTYSRWGGFMSHLEDFDAEFFNIAPREARLMDPQQRVLLETAWEAVEDAGCQAETLSLNSVGVFVGCSSNGYYSRIVPTLTAEDHAAGVGNHNAVLANRLSFFLNLQGPSLVIDTACSSSLVAIHQACQSLRSGECHLAFAAGVNTLLEGDYYVAGSRMKLHSPDGRCKAFDHRADGIAVGEGVGVILLKPLHAAIAAGDPIRAVIKGSAVNHGGLTNGITVPDPNAQANLVAQALNNAGLSAEEISYVEAHGTGTSLGDPIEIAGLTKAFRRDTENNQFCHIGSVKTNIGHLEAAAGIAGVMKVVLSLQHQQLPPSLHFEQANPRIQFDQTPFVVNTELSPWKGTEKRRAGVSSFGIGGTNAHVILEEVESRKSEVGSQSVRPSCSEHLLTLSAKSEAALDELIRAYQQHLEKYPALALADICFTSNTGRSHFNYRVAIAASTSHDLANHLRQLDTQADIPVGYYRNHVVSKGSKIAFLFTGQGSQYVNMGRQLYEIQPLFREILDRCNGILRAYLDLDILDMLYPDISERGQAQGQSLQIDQTAYTQPALFVIEYALTKLWQSWGIQPSMVLGHSIGEYAAACVAGVFSLEDGLKLVAHRGRLMQQLPGGGAMVSIMASAAEIEPRLAPYGGQVTFAAINGPESVVISGSARAIQAIQQDLDTEGFKTKRLTVSHAFHSPLMEPMVEEFGAIANQITYHLPEIPMVSTVTGQWVDDAIATPQYWIDHVRQPVRFAQGMDCLFAQKCSVFLEVGPNPILLGMGQHCLPAETLMEDNIWLPSLHPQQNDWQQILHSLGHLYVHGVSVDWQGLHQTGEHSQQKVTLPTYPFQRQRYWVDAIPANATLSNASKESFQPDFYQVQWQQLPQAPSQIALEPGHWLIFADRLGVGEALGQKLQKQGHGYTLVYQGETTQSMGDGQYQLNPTDAQVFEQLYQTILSDAEQPIDRVVHCWSLDVPATAELTSSNVMQAQRDTCGTVLNFVQALATTNAVPKLWLVTEGSQPVMTPASSDKRVETLAVGQSSLWGLGRVIAFEHPHLWGGLIDLEPNEFRDSATIESLLKQIWQEDREDHIALRQRQAYGARLVRQSRSESRPLVIREDATYLITGGLGALGLQVAQWLVAAGATSLVLVSRRPPSSEKQRQIDALEAAGVNVLMLLGDVASEAFVAHILEQIVASLSPLRGIIHGAGVLDDGVLQQLTWERFTAVMAPKVQGAWNLHQLTQAIDLDYFVCFSSVAALLGSPGQGNYAAANAFMDALVHHRRGMGLPGLSINWSGWKQSGMVATSTHTAGIDTLSPEQGLQALADLLSDADARGQTAVMLVDWPQLTQRWRCDRTKPGSLLADWLTQYPDPSADSSKPAKSSLLTHLDAALEQERREILQNYLQRHIAQVLGYEEIASISHDRGFTELGMDSLMVVELINRLRQQLNQPLSTTLALEYSTINKLTDHLLQEVLQFSASASQAIEPSPGTSESPKQTDEDAIAIVGMGCRFPGGADSPEKFWSLLSQGVDAVAEIPTERWNIDSLYDSDPDAAGKMYIRSASLLSQVDQFEPEFFGISPREAKHLDPQHRLLLEVSWEALERAGQASDQLQDSQTGVFIGIGQNDYSQLGMQDLDQITAYDGTGNSFSCAAGRLSYVLGLQGPTLAIDTACSSSLVAIHLACQSLRHGECDLALAGGVQLILAPFTTTALSRIKALSPDGRCKTFDATADGYGRGEGCGIVVLKSLSQAQAAGDPILGIIRGSAVNHDGASSGLTVPNRFAQEKLLRHALTNSGVEAHQVSYLEAHGTGTPLGDPIEIRALNQVFGPDRLSNSPLAVGSVKTNIGHLEAAAGVAGLIKIVLQLQHRQIAPHLHFETPNPHVDWSDLPMTVPTQLTAWDGQSGARIAGVSSFGFSGTNAHVVLAEGGRRKAEGGRWKNVLQSRSIHLLTLSAKSDRALDDLIRQYQRHLESHSELELADICFTANTGRSHFNYRVAIATSTSAELAQTLKQINSQEEAPVGVYRHHSAGVRPKVAFLFTGQGSQYVDMGRQLYETQPLFREILEHCNEILRPYLGGDILAILYPDLVEGGQVQDQPLQVDPGQAQGQPLPSNAHPLLNQTIYTQPALFVIEYALAKLWQSWGIQPDVLMGHSIGEYAAACVAGVFSLEDGLKLVAHRGRLMQQLPAGGAMLSILASEAEISPRLSAYGGQVTFAAINGPRSIVVSGTDGAIQALQQTLETDGFKTKRLQVSHAFHSQLMEPMMAEFGAIANQITYHSPTLPFVSNVTGHWADASVATADYWVNHVRQPVRFAQGMDTLLTKDCDVFLEVGPKPILLGMAQRCEEKGLWLPSLRPGQADWQQIFQSLSQIYVHGGQVNWQGVEQGYGHQKIVLPTYPFQRQRYWLDEISQNVRASNRQRAGHPLLGRQIPLPGVDDQARFESVVAAESPNYLGHHQVFDQVLFPMMGYVEMAFAAAHAHRKDSHWTLEDLVIRQGLIFPDGNNRTVQTVLTSDTSDDLENSLETYRLQIFSEALPGHRSTENSGEDDQDSEWILHAEGLLRAGTADADQEPTDQVALEQIKAACPEAIQAVDHYQTYQQQGITYGPSFQGVQRIWQGEHQAIARIELPQSLNASATAYQLHPALLDAATQVLIYANSLAEADLAPGQLYLPAAVDQVRVSQSAKTAETRMWAIASVQPSQPLKGDIILANDQGSVLAHIKGLKLVSTTSDALLKGLKPGFKDWCYRLDWQLQPYKPPQELSPKPAAGTWLLLANEDGLAKQLAAALKQQSQQCIWAVAGTEYRQLDAAQYQIPPTQPEAFDQLLQDCGPIRGVIHFWGESALKAPLDLETVQTAQEIGCGSVLHLVQALNKHSSQQSGPANPTLWLMTQAAQPVLATDVAQPQQSPLWGLGRVITLEYPDLSCRQVDLPPYETQANETQADDSRCGRAGTRHSPYKILPENLTHRLVQELLWPTVENQIAYRQGKCYVARLVRSYHSNQSSATLSPATQPVQLKLSEYGLLENLSLHPLKRRPPSPGEVEIQVKAVGLNLRDVLNALGLLQEYYAESLGITHPDQLTFGFECTGIITAVGDADGEKVSPWQVGDEVIAILLPDGFSSYVTVPNEWVMPKPAAISFTEAATLPLTFLTAYYGLHYLADIQPGDRVLIHSAAGGVGQAAVQIAQRAGAEVFATASPPKWDWLKQQGVEHVMNSRNLDFAAEIHEKTQGQGVDIVLNSLTGDFIDKSFDALADDGRFIEIGKLGIWSPEQVQRQRPDVGYYPFDLGDVAQDHPDLIQNLWRELSQHFVDKTLQPLPHRLFPINQVMDAFRFMQKAQHIGKVVVSFADEISASSAPSAVAVRAEASYLITGGLGALGLEVAQWLAQQGAVHLVLVGRSTPSQSVQDRLSLLEDAGAQVSVIQTDITQKRKVEQLFQHIATHLPTLRGVIHAAGVLDDSILQDMSWSRFAQVMAPKVQGAWLLHEGTQELDLDFFICFSSVASLLGSPGQGNYAAANAFLDALVHYRQAQGLPGLSINWGGWSLDGMAANVERKHQVRQQVQGLRAIEPGAGLQILGNLLGTSQAQVGIFPVSWPQFFTQLPKNLALPVLDNFRGAKLSPSKSSEVLVTLKATPGEERREILVKFVQQQVGQVLGMTDVQRIESRVSLFDLGMDSLMAVEFRNRLQSELSLSMPSTLLFDYPTLEALVDYLEQDILSLDAEIELTDEKSQGVSDRNPDLTRSQSNAVAIIGMGCRFPGGVTSPEEFWQLLQQGRDAISQVPSERWSVEQFYDPNPDAVGKMISTEGGFLDQVDGFDAQFFGIAPKEAQSLDPQQRLLLEVSWEALERAHQLPEQLYNSLTGVFVGISTQDYANRLSVAGQIPDAYLGTGNSLSAAAGRLSYQLGLTGPSLAVDTACSSSLISVHLACQSLQQQECHLALAGGVNLMLSPRNSIVFSQAGMLAPDGRCKTFDAAANGYGRGEGCGMVVLKRLADALADGDPILAVIRGSATNQDGPSGGLTVPNGPSQEAVIQQALANAGVPSHRVSYVEAHGTGTPLGDPIEVRALNRVLGQDRSSMQPLIIGSVKTNMGHLEAAAGIAGLMKVVLQLQHQQIVPHLHFDTPNPHLDWEHLAVKIPTQLTAWDGEGEPRIAGVSSFGFSGTNVHVVLEEVGRRKAEGGRRKVSPRRPEHLLTLSAKNRTALDALVGEYQRYLETHSDLGLADICFTSNTGRSHFNYRVAIATTTLAELTHRLQQLGSQSDIPVGCSRNRVASERSKIAFLFTGQGSQYINMGRQLYGTQPLFREILDHCNEMLQESLDLDILDILYRDISEAGQAQGQPLQIDQTAYTQPALFVLEYALAKLWQSWGIEPSVVMGHSIGEYVAACIAGVFSLADGLKLVAHRGRLMQQLPSGGAMLSILGSEAEINARLMPYKEQVTLASINGPKSVVVSGEDNAIQALQQVLDADGFKTKRLRVSHAFHSPLMEPMMAEFGAIASQITYHSPTLPLISNVTGQWADESMATADYWVNHVRQPVRVAQGMETLLTKDCDVFLEMGPKPILLGIGRQCLSEESFSEEKGLWLPSLRSGQDDWQQMLESLGHLYTHGVEVNWQNVAQGQHYQKVPLPTYPFQRQRYWVETSMVPTIPKASSTSKTEAHPLLGRRFYSATQPQQIQFEAQLSALEPGYLAEHRIFGQVLFPIAGYLEIAIAAGHHVFARQGTLNHDLLLEDITIHQGFILSETETTTIQTVLNPVSGNAHRYEFQILSLQLEEQQPKWTLHVQGQLSALDGSTTPNDIDIEALKVACLEAVEMPQLYQTYQQRGIDYGPQFQGIQQLWRGSNQIVGQLVFKGSDDPEDYHMHPTLLDSALQSLAPILLQEGPTYLPIALEKLHWRRGEKTLNPWVAGSIITDAASSRKATLSVSNVRGRAIIDLSGLTLVPVTDQAVLKTPDLYQWYHQLQWQALPSSQDPLAPTTQGIWLVLAPDVKFGQQLKNALNHHAQACVVVYPGSDFCQVDDGQYQLAPSQPEALRQVLASLKQNCALTETPLLGILHLWSLATDLEDLDHAETLTCGMALHLLQGMTTTWPDTPLPPLWLITQGAHMLPDQQYASCAPQHQLLWGLGRVIALEYPDVSLRCLDLDPAADQVVQDLVQALLESHGTGSTENQIAYRRGLRHVARLGQFNPKALAHQTHQSVQLKLHEYGRLDQLSWQPLERSAPKPGEVEIQVKAVGLNLRDVLNALGLLKDYYAEQFGITQARQLTFGFECVGIVTAVGDVGEDKISPWQVGDEVIAILLPDGFSRYVTVTADWVIAKPKAMSFSEAATLPLTYLTAYYGLHHLAKLQPGDRVLIHSAAGGVGQAAVQIAQQVGAEIFATASPAKLDWLKQQGIEHVMNSRSLDFATEIQERTQGQGVDIVLNSFTGEFIDKGFEVLAENGHFVEIGKLGIWSAERVAQHRPDVSYFPFDLGEVAQTVPRQLQDLWCDLSQQFSTGHLKPLPHRVFAADDVVDAFRFMQKAQHIGKVVVQFPDGPVSIQAEGSYLITGGLGALGLDVAQWLGRQGAKHLVLAGRSQPSPVAQQIIADLQANGTQVSALQVDITQRADVAQLFQQIAALPTLRGVIHAAGVLDDGVLQEMSRSRFAQVLAPKVKGAWLLHENTKHLDLDFFVCFSSVASLLGAPGQGNYAAANAFLDGLAHYRQAQGLPGLSINWGRWSSGMAANLPLQDRRGLGIIAPATGVQVLGDLLATAAAQVAVLPADWSQFFEQLPRHLTMPVLEGLRPAEPSSQPSSTFLQRLETAPIPGRKSLLIQFIQKNVGHTLGIADLQQIDPQESLFDMGMDSLMAVEFRNRLQSELQISISSTVLFDYPSVDAIATYLFEKIFPPDHPDPTPPHRSPQTDVSEIRAEVTQLSEAEAEVILLQELESITQSSGGQ